MKESANKKAKSKKEWEGIIEEWKGSGLSKYEYCREKKIYRSTFYKWCKKLRDEQEELGKSRFIPIIIKDREKEREEGIKSELSIESASGIKVKFKSGCKIEEIKAIVGILRC